MNYQKPLTILVVLIVLLTLIAAGAGVFWQGNGVPYSFQTLRGEMVEIHGRGLYRYDSVPYASQAIGQDIVTLIIGIPLLVIGLVLARKGALRGKLLLTGTLFYFLYTYTSYSFASAYNELFLVYVALFSLSLSAFVLALLTIDVPRLPAHFSERLPRRGIAGFLFAIGGFLLLAWLGRIVPPLLDGTPPYGLESYTTLPIQVLDLGVIVPLTLTAAILLLKRLPFGYLLASIAMIKGFTMGLALIAMIIGQILAGVAISAVESVVFTVIALIAAGLTFVLFKNVSEQPIIA